MKYNHVAEGGKWVSVSAILLDVAEKIGIPITIWPATPSSIARKGESRQYEIDTTEDKIKQFKEEMRKRYN